MQSLDSIRTKAHELTKTSPHPEVRLLAELVTSLAESFVEVEAKAKQAHAETKRLKFELKKSMRENVQE